MIMLSRPKLGLPRRLAMWLALLALFAGFMFWTGEKWANATANETASADARQLAVSNAALFDSELEKFRLLLLALAEYPDVASLLKTGGQNSGSVNDRLERLAEKTNAAAIYVIDPLGRTLAASNYRKPTSFVGQNYAFRPYFRDALANGDAELFALGTVSGRPGLYLSRRINQGGSILGILVVKIELDDRAREWSRQVGISMIADSHGVIILSGKSDWQFRTQRALRPAEKAEIEASRQFEGKSLQRLPFDPSRADVVIDGKPHRSIASPVGLKGGELVVLMPTQRALEGARAQARIIVVLILFILFAILAWQYRQLERTAIQRQVQRELEHKVAERTFELEEANKLLVIESGERAISEQKYRQSREELAQANRLGTLGQVTAGVAHEINQPVAAIRAFAENAIAFLGRSKPQSANENLQQIVGLTQRIAVITGELRGFARRKTPAIGPTSLADAIEAALLLVKHRITGTNTKIVWNKQAAAIVVRADRIRLEQVFVNLIQNSLDAFDGRKGGRLEINFHQNGEEIIVIVADDGPGFPEQLKPKVFIPFSTGKEEGLGLGLAIVRDIVREFGGDIRLLSGKGARFELRFVKA
jgi:two-component system, NtrC family, C4-dicarboxylate transport sensor histidine kinase DctB